MLDRESVATCSHQTNQGAVAGAIFTGHFCDMDVWSAFCKDSGINLVEDCAQAHGPGSQGKALALFGEVSAFSFYPTKILAQKAMPARW